MVDKINLEKSDIDKAKDLLHALDNSMLKPNSFFWFYISDSKVWRLVIASSIFNNKSTHEVYENFVNKFRNNNNVKEIGLENITLLNSNNDLIKILKSAINTESKSVSEIRFKASTINNVYIDDAYIYRLS
ncbi:MAG: hypothetical protein RI947_639 [Candidatus Parcubacteria bacterium]|jgi:hypothetical protein